MTNAIMQKEARCSKGAPAWRAFGIIFPFGALGGAFREKYELEFAPFLCKRRGVQLGSSGMMNKKRREAMKAMLKEKTKQIMTVTALLVLAGCCGHDREEAPFDKLRNNELVYTLAWSGLTSDGTAVEFVEKVSANNGIRVCHAVCYDGDNLQAYRIEGRNVVTYRYLKDSLSVVDDAETFLRMTIRKLENPHAFSGDKSMEKYYAEQTEKVSGQINAVASGDMLGILPQEGLRVMYAGTGYAFAFSSFRKETREWVSSEVPLAVEAFYQRVLQETSKPEHKRSFPSYVRAIPLFTEEELAAEKDTPVFDWEKAGYHVLYACRYPYALIPVLENDSPFPSVKTYVPGNKFKVSREGYGDGEPPYFLIETFAGGAEG